MSELVIPDDDFQFEKIEELPYYWRLKIQGWNRRSPACPRDGGALTRREKPIDHLSCVKCGRNYV